MSRYATDIGRPNVRFRGFESRPGDYVVEEDGVITFCRRDGSPLLIVRAPPGVLAQQLTQLGQLSEVERHLGDLGRFTQPTTPEPERPNRAERRATAARARRSRRP